MKKIVPVTGIAALGIAAFLYFGDGFGFGKGEGEGTGKQEVQTEVSADTTETTEKKEDTILIKVDENTITVNGEQLADTEALKNKICELASKNKDYTYDYDASKAIKATSEEVRKALQDLEASLNIKINNLD